MMISRLYVPGFELWRDAGDTDEWGTTVEKFEKLKKLEGRLRPLSGDLRMSADKQGEFATHKFYCHPQDIRPGDRIRYQGEMFKVSFVADPMDMNMFLQVELEILPDLRYIWTPMAEAQAQGVMPE